MLRYNWTAPNIAQPSVIGLGDYREVEFLWRMVAHRERAYRIAHDADLVRVRDTDWRSEQALLRDPGQAGHFAVAVEREGAGKNVIGPDLGPTWPDSCNSCAHHVGPIAYHRAA